MAAEKRDDDLVVALRERLLRTGIPRTTFFAAMRLLERLTTAPTPRVGGDGPAAQECIEFGNSPSMSSLPNELQSIRWLEVPRSADGRLDRPKHRYRVETGFLGLFGASSPLPLFYAGQFVADLDSAAAQRDFLDLFHNRLTALFYRAVGKYDYPSEFLSDGSDRMSTRLLALSGLDIDARSGGEGLTPLEWLHVSALTGGPPTARTLRSGLRTLLGLELDGAPLDVVQFTGGWVRVDPSQHNKLGRANNETATTFMIGTRVRHPGHRARVRIGPIMPDEARQFEPGGPAYLRTQKVVRALCPEPTGFDLELLVDEAGYPPFVLGSRKLGSDVYITGRPADSRVASYVYPLG